MKVYDLYKQVAGLGFESSLDDDSRFYYAANRALLQVARIRPATRTHHINHKPLKNALATSFSSIECRGDLVLEASEAKGYYFEADGNGRVYIEFLKDGEWAPAKDEILQSNRTFKAYHGLIQDGTEFVKGAVRIRFLGDYLYHVRRVALYPDVYSGDPDEVPAYEPYSKYDISNLATDFLAMSAPPIVDSEGREVLNQHYDIEDGRIVLLPRNMPGEYIVRYIKKPTPLDDTKDVKNNDKDIDLDDDLCAILPNLIASYLYAEDEPQLAEYYLALYNQQAMVIEQKARHFSSVFITNNGW